MSYICVCGKKTESEMKKIIKENNIQELEDFILFGAMFQCKLCQPECERLISENKEIQ